MPIKTLTWENDFIKMIDQTQLPKELVYLEIKDIPALAEAIKSLRVRGAPAIGIAAAFGVLLSAQLNKLSSSKIEFFSKLNESIEILRATRPTAVNLSWALDRMKRIADSNQDKNIPEIIRALQIEAMSIFEEDRKTNRKLAAFGAELILQNAKIITHCNTGALATADYGTALGCIFTAHSQGKNPQVWVDETRPLLQGARLNMWELENENIPATLICDNTAAFVMQRTKIDLCIVGADRIAANGDTANKIGTYNLAISAKYHGVPFYIAAPISTFDITLETGSAIPIEERSQEEVKTCIGFPIAPIQAQAYSPAFDVTPSSLITGIITDKGIIRPPYKESTLATLKKP